MMLYYLTDGDVGDVWGVLGWVWTWRRLQDVIVATPQGIPRLMDMMLEREVCPMFTNAFSIYHFLNQGRSVCSKMLQTKHFLIV